MRKALLVGLVALALLLAACGDDDDTAGADTSTSTTDASSDGSVQQNACPADGCTIGFQSVTKAGDELEVTFDMNFDPDIANNHIHIYWDNFTAAQVSNDAADNNLEQGEWVPTDTAPVYVTDGAVSTAVRGDSTILCVVSADRDHNVINAPTEICMDVSEHL